jgi:hypothetical protein
MTRISIHDCTLTDSISGVYAEMSKVYRDKVADYPTETAALVFIKAASRPLSDHSMLRRADSRKVTTKILSLRGDADRIPFAHVVYGPVDIVALVQGKDQVERRDVVALIRGLKDGDHGFNFVCDSVSQPIISMYGRPPTRATWVERDKYCGWLFAKVSDMAPAENLAARLLQHEYISFVAPLTGEFDLATFIEAPSNIEFDKFIDNEIGLYADFYFSDTRILSSSQSV